MCGFCAALGGATAWEQEGLACESGPHHRRREAVAASAELSTLLAARRIKVDAHPDFGFIVSFPTGGAEIVEGMAGVWHLLDRQGLPIPDPLADE